jgi:hypothetical protein
MVLNQRDLVYRKGDLAESPVIGFIDIVQDLTVERPIRVEWPAGWRHRDMWFEPEDLILVTKTFKIWF